MNKIKLIKYSLLAAACLGFAVNKIESRVTFADEVEVESYDQLKQLIEEMNNGDSKTLKLKNNINVSGTTDNIEVKEGTTVTVDFNGFKIENIAQSKEDNTMCFTVNGDLTFTSNVENKGTFKGAKGSSGIGSMVVSNNGTLTISNMIIDDCDSSGISGSRGGFVYSNGKSINFIDSTFTNCDSYNGGVVLITKSTDFTATNCVFTNNSALYNGGVICADGDDSKSITLTITDCKFDGNTLYEGASSGFNNASGGTVIYNGGRAFLYIYGGEFINNKSTGTGCGGTIYSNGFIYINKDSNKTTLFKNNEARIGGCISLYGKIAKLYNCTFKENATLVSSPIVTECLDALFENCIIEENSVTSVGNQECSTIAGLNGYRLFGNFELKVTEFKDCSIKNNTVNENENETYCFYLSDATSDSSLIFSGNTIIENNDVNEDYNFSKGHNYATFGVYRGYDNEKFITIKDNVYISDFKDKNICTILYDEQYFSNPEDFEINYLRSIDFTNFDGEKTINLVLKPISDANFNTLYNHYKSDSTYQKICLYDAKGKNLTVKLDSTNAYLTFVGNDVVYKFGGINVTYDETNKNYCLVNNLGLSNLGYQWFESTYVVKPGRKVYGPNVDPLLPVDFFYFWEYFMNPDTTLDICSYNPTTDTYFNFTESDPNLSEAIESISGLDVPDQLYSVMGYCPITELSEDYKELFEVKEYNIKLKSTTNHVYFVSALNDFATSEFTNLGNGEFEIKLSSDYGYILTDAQGEISEFNVYDVSDEKIYLEGETSDKLSYYKTFNTKFYGCKVTIPENDCLLEQSISSNLMSSDREVTEVEFDPTFVINDGEDIVVGEDYDIPVPKMYVNGEEIELQEVNIEYFKYVSEDWNKIDTKPTTPGRYKAKVSIKDDNILYYGSIEREFNIIKVDGSITDLHIEGWSYGETPKTPTSTSNAPVKYTYAVKGTDTFTETAPINAGDYILKAYIEESESYNAYSTTIEFSIAKANIDLKDVAIENWVEGETPKTPTASTNFGVVEYMYSKKGVGNFSPEVPVEAGEYTLKAYVEGDNNHNMAVKEIDFKITSSEPINPSEEDTHILHYLLLILFVVLIIVYFILEHRFLALVPCALLLASGIVGLILRIDCVFCVIMSIINILVSVVGLILIFIKRKDKEGKKETAKEDKE